MTISKLGLYNSALRRAGSERLSDLTENREARHKLDEIWDAGAVKHCARLALPGFARKTVAFTSSTTVSTHGFQYEHDLPSDFAGLVGLFLDEDLDTESQRRLVEGGKLYTENASVWLRYAAVYDSDFTNWTTDFESVVAAWLAYQYRQRTDPETASLYRDVFDNEVQQSRALSEQDESSYRPQKSSTTLSNDWLTLYNAALSHLGRPRVTSLQDERQEVIALHTARESRLVESLFSDYTWQFGGKTVKLTYNSHLEPAWGYNRGFTKPTDILRFDGIFFDEYQRSPIRDYREQDGVIYTRSDDIWIKYVSTSLLTQPSSWPVLFWQYVAAAMAEYAKGQVPGLDDQTSVRVHDVYMNAKRDAENWDFLQSPPQVINQGSWVRSKLQNYRHGDRGR